MMMPMLALPKTLVLTAPLPVMALRTRSALEAATPSWTSCVRRQLPPPRSLLRARLRLARASRRRRAFLPARDWRLAPESVLGRTSPLGWEPPFGRRWPLGPQLRVHRESASAREARAYAR